MTDYKFDYGKSIVTLQRFYNISKDDLYFKYSWNDIQEMIRGIPVRDLVYLRPKMSTSEINAQWMENFFTRKTQEDKRQDYDSFAEEFKKKSGKDPRLQIFK